MAKKEEKISAAYHYIGKGIALAGMYIAGAWFATNNPGQAEVVLGALGGGTLLVLFFW